MALSLDNKGHIICIHLLAQPILILSSQEGDRDLLDKRATIYAVGHAWCHTVTQSCASHKGCRQPETLTQIRNTSAWVGKTQPYVTGLQNNLFTPMQVAPISTNIVDLSTKHLMSAHQKLFAHCGRKNWIFCSKNH